MSFRSELENALNSTILKYIDNIASKYNLEKDELYKIWTGSCGSTPNISPTTNPELEKLSKKELTELCKGKNLKVSGTRGELISRILDYDSKLSQKPSQTIIKKLTEKIPKLELYKNQFGYFEHRETKFVFDTKTQKVFGKQNDDGSIEELDAEDIETCKKYKFLYNIPLNLDKKVNVLDVKVDELDDELEVEEELDEDDLCEYEEELEEVDEDEEEYYEE